MEIDESKTSSLRLAGSVLTIALLLGAWADYLFFKQPLGLSLLAFCLAGLGGLYFLSRRGQKALAGTTVTMRKCALKPSFDTTITGRDAPFCSCPTPGSRSAQKTSQRCTGPACGIGYRPGSDSPSPTAASKAAFVSSISAMKAGSAAASAYAAYTRCCRRSRNRATTASSMNASALGAPPDSTSARMAAVTVSRSRRVTFFSGSAADDRRRWRLATGA